MFFVLTSRPDPGTCTWVMKFVNERSEPNRSIAYQS